MNRLFVSNKDESARMFSSDFLEMFSRIHWSVPLFIFIPIILFFLYLSFSGPLGWILIVSLFISGGFAWTLAEYILHRFVFHYQPKSETGKRLHFMFHGVHHDYPQDSKRLVMVPSVSLPLGAFFFFVFNFLMGPVYSDPFFSGFVAGYLCYDMIHYSTHHFAFRNKLFLKLKAYHMKHHYSDPNNGFGVSQNLWDQLFRTTYRDGKKELKTQQ